MSASQTWYPLIRIRIISSNLFFRASDLAGYDSQWPDSPDMEPADRCDHRMEETTLRTSHRNARTQRHQLVTIHAT